ncbi:MAG: ABC transporter permease [Patescibacteria group bacterium]|nr:ABC transporter permease [Candidatus Beckwithbacteria bacterium]MDZ4228872.1 ABC transporter permease [Patescibacteria group bacterium]
MRFSEIVNSAQEALKGSRLRTALTMLGIIIGISSVILISSIGQGAVAYITDEFSSFGTNFFQITSGRGFLAALGGTSNPLTKKDADAIGEESGIDNIESVTAFTFTSGQVAVDDVENTYLIYGMTSESQVILKPDLVYGEFFSQIHDDGVHSVVVIGQDVAKDLFGEDTNPVGESIRIDNSKYRIIGVTKSGGGLSGSQFNNAVNMPLETMTTKITGDDAIQEMDISVYDESQLNQTMDDVEVFLRDRRNLDEDQESDFTLQSQAETLERIQKITGLLTAMVAGISGISLIVGGVGVMNIMLVTVTERTKEIGLLKAIGAKDKDILSQFLIESMTLSVVGGIIGILIGVTGAFIVAQIANIPFVVSITTVVLAVAVSSLVGIIFGLYPARRAAKLNPIDALRHE